MKSYDERTKFFMAAKRLWKELGLTEKLKKLLKERENIGDKEKFFDVSGNPFFIIENEFRKELLKKGIIEKNDDEDDKMVTAYLITEFAPSLIKRASKRIEKALEKDAEDCDGDCEHCERGDALKEIIHGKNGILKQTLLGLRAKLEEEEKRRRDSNPKDEFGNFDNPGGIWN